MAYKGLPALALTYCPNFSSPSPPLAIPWSARLLTCSVDHSFFPHHLLFIQ